jgi:hypothetical protein
MVYGDAMSNFDYYAVARSLITLLGVEGHLSEAKKLKSALEDGSTGTEILMALRFHLKGCIQRVSLTAESQTLALRLLSELDKALA